MSIKEDLAAFCAIEVQMKRLEAEKSKLRRRLLDHAHESYESEGAAPTWRTDLGTVWLALPKPRVEVFDEDQFAKSAVEILGAGAVEVVTRVRPEHRASLLSSITMTPTAIPITAEGEPVGGVIVSPRPPYLGIKLKPQETEF